MPPKERTTHVVEIESGIGEPQFIPLTLGKELEPISVGRKGMWRIESAGVLDTHAFVYFDGASLFLRSAETHNPAVADGEAVGPSWSEIAAPCRIEVGTARLRFRSLLAADQPRSAPPPTPKRTPAPPIVQLPPSAMPASFPKPARPFSPGELVSEREPGEDTRVKPFDRAPRSVPPQEVARFAQTAGMPAAPVPQQVHARRSTGPLPPPDPMMTTGPGTPSGHAMMVTGPMMPPGHAMITGPSYPPHMQQPTGPSLPSPHAGPPLSSPHAGPHAPYGYGVQPMTGPPPPVAPVAPAAAPAGPSLLARFKELNGPKKILVVLAPFCLASSAYLILFDEPPPAGPAPVAIADAGTHDARVAVATVAPSAAPLPPSCPPGFVPWPVPINGTIPCVPAAAAASVATTVAPPPPASTPVAATSVPTAATKPTASPTPPTSAPAPEPAPPVGTRTLERLAVDAVAMNDYPRAAKLYEQLQQQNPTNRVYAEAARILRAKADAGAP